MRDFNTAGPVRPEDHYCVRPLDRVDLGDVLSLVRGKRYFVMHAPRQTGKTSVLLALRDLLNGGEEGEFRCAYINVESAQTAREDVGLAMRAIASEIAIEAEDTLDDVATANEVNATGRIEREYALGSRRVDLLIVWPRGERSEERFVVECKLVKDGRSAKRVIERGLEQTAAYMDTSGASAGHLVVFDLREGRTWADRVYRERSVWKGTPITVWGA